MTSKPEARLQELGLTLPPPPKPVAKYKTAVLAGGLLYVSGHGPARISDKTPVTGRVGADLTTEQGKESARAVGLNILSTVRNTLGSLDKVKRLVKTLGMVNCTADYKDQPQVINGFSELMAEVFGEDAGVGARSAVGMGRCRATSPSRSSAFSRFRSSGKSGWTRRAAAAISPRWRPPHPTNTRSFSTPSAARWTCCSTSSSARRWTSATSPWRA